MAEDNEEANQTPPAEAGGEERQEGKAKGLEGIVNNVWKEIKDFGRKALITTSIIGMPFVMSPLGGETVARAAVLGYGLTAGKATANVIQNKPIAEGTIKQSAFGTALSYPLAKWFTGLNTLENIVDRSYGIVAAKSAKIGAQLAITRPLGVGLHTGFTKGFGAGYWERYKKALINSYKWTGIPAAINVGFIYKFGLLAQFFMAMGNTFLFSLVNVLSGEKGSIRNLFKALNPVPYMSAGIGVPRKAVSNTISYAYGGAYGLGEAVRSIFPRRKSTFPERKESSPEPGESSEYRRAPATSKYIPFPKKRTRQYENKAA